MLIDHLGWPSRGTPAEYEDVLALAKVPTVFIKVSGLLGDYKPIIRRLYDAFGADRLVWGSYGTDMAAFQKILAQIDDVFDYAPEAERVKIRGQNAMKLFKFRV